MPYPDLRKGETYEDYLERRRKANKAYRDSHAEKMRAVHRHASKRYYQAHTNDILKRQQRYVSKNPEQRKATRIACHRRFREKVLGHYGGKCVCCGESTFEFLCIDHINGGGHQQRQIIGRHGGIGFLRWVYRENYPEDLQVLCHNCNMAKAFYGSCPHHALISSPSF